MFLEVFLFAFLPPIRRVRNEKRTGTRRSAIGLISYPDLRRVKQSEIWVRDYYWPSSSSQKLLPKKKKRLVPVSFWFLKWRISTFVLGKYINTLKIKCIIFYNFFRNQNGSIFFINICYSNTGSGWTGSVKWPKHVHIWEKVL